MILTFLTAWNVALIFSAAVSLFLLIMPWVPPAGGVNVGDVSFFYASYTIAGVGIIAFCGRSLRTKRQRPLTKNKYSWRVGSIFQAVPDMAGLHIERRSCSSSKWRVIQAFRAGLQPGTPQGRNPGIPGRDSRFRPKPRSGGRFTLSPIKLSTGESERCSHAADLVYSCQ